jgi:hypothetical protein
VPPEFTVPLPAQVFVISTPQSVKAPPTKSFN